MKSSWKWTRRSVFEQVNLAGKWSFTLKHDGWKKQPEVTYWCALYNYTHVHKMH